MPINFEPESFLESTSAMFSHVWQGLISYACTRSTKDRILCIEAMALLCGTVHV
jgi:hypothetical protein